MKATAMSTIVILSFGLYVANDYKRFTPPDYASPTEEAHESEEGEEGEENQEFKRDRKQWIEEMHRTAPDVEWKKRDLLIRRLQYQQKKIGLFKKSAQEGVPEDASGEWVERGSDNQTGRIKTTAFDSVTQQVYAATGGGNIWVGDLNGSNWVCLNNEYRLEDIRFLKINYVNGKKRITVVQGSPSVALYSDDDGLSWHKADGLDNAARWGSVKRALQREDGALLLLVKEWDYSEEFYWGELTSLYKSTDNGESFQRIQALPDDASLYDIYTTDNEGIYIIRGKALLYFSKDNIMVNMSAFKASYHSYEIDKVYMVGRGDNIYVAHYINNNTIVYKSSDKGKNWKSIGRVVDDYPFTQNSMYVSIQDPDDIYIGGVRLFKNKHNKKKFKQLNNWEDYYSNVRFKLHADIPSIKSIITASGDEMFFVSTDGGLYVSYDAFKSVHNISLSGLRNSQYYGTYTNRHNWNTVVAGSQDQGVQRVSVDSKPLLSFNQDYSGDYGHLVSSNGGKTLWMSYPGFVLCYPSLPEDSTFYIWSYSEEEMSNSIWMPPLMADPDDPNSVYIGGGTPSYGAYVYHVTLTENDFDSKRLQHNFGANYDDASISALDYSKVNSARRYISTNRGDFFWSENGGESWSLTQNFTVPKPKYFYGATIATSPVDEQVVVVGGSGYSNAPVYLSNNGGETFEPISVGLPETLVHDLEFSTDGHRLYAATEVGAYVYIDSLKSWYNLEGPDQVYWNVEYLEGIQKVRFATFGRGIWDLVLAKGAVSHVGLPPDNTKKVKEFTSDVTTTQEGVSVRSRLFHYQSGIAKIQAPEYATICEVYDVHGKKFLTKRVSGHEYVDLDEGLLAPGTYVISFIN